MLTLVIVDLVLRALPIFRLLRKKCQRSKLSPDKVRPGRTIQGREINLLSTEMQAELIFEKKPSIKFGIENSFEQRVKRYFSLPLSRQ